MTNENNVYEILPKTTLRPSHNMAHWHVVSLSNCLVDNSDTSSMNRLITFLSTRCYMKIALYIYHNNRYIFV